MVLAMAGVVLVSVAVVAGLIVGLVFLAQALAS
jgi:hypothetical protein